ncbi:helix-turn-helix domain-containing protein [Glutamicibacter sp. AGC13]
MNVALYSPEEVSVELRRKVSPWTIRKLAREKKIAHTRVERGKILFTEAQVKAFLESCVRQADSAPEVEPEALAFQGTSRSPRARAGAATV